MQAKSLMAFLLALTMVLGLCVNAKLPVRAEELMQEPQETEAPTEAATLPEEPTVPQETAEPTVPPEPTVAPDLETTGGQIPGDFLDMFVTCTLEAGKTYIFEVRSDTKGYVGTMDVLPSKLPVLVSRTRSLPLRAPRCSIPTCWWASARNSVPRTSPCGPT